uniref:Uncharacterized protein n=1 Tax=Anguilla anguilla TaxID=7936 RepID=A0A0E9TPI2_ANGAN
MFIPINVSIK